MNTKLFVTGSSIILAGWLGATFFNDVPSQRYPKLDRSPATASLNENFQPDLSPRSGPSHSLPISVSR
jgi:hypothetical protein